MKEKTKTKCLDLYSWRRMDAIFPNGIPSVVVLMMVGQSTQISHRCSIGIDFQLGTVKGVAYDAVY